MKAKIKFARLSPFDIALTGFVDGKEVILIDKKFKNSWVLGYILKHEMKHIESGKILDLWEDFGEIGKQSLEVRDEFIRVKPLSLLQFFVPFTWFKIGKRRFYRIVWFRITVFVIICMVVLLLYL